MNAKFDSQLMLLIVLSLSLQNQEWIVWGIIALAVLLLLAFLVPVVLRVLRREKESSTPTQATSRKTTPPRLEVVNAQSGPKHLILKPEGNVVGRDPETDIVITDIFSGWETVSPWHARIYAKDGRWIIEDLGSMNGVYVNGKRTGKNLLRKDWHVGIGGVEFIFHPPSSKEEN